MQRREEFFFYTISLVILYPTYAALPIFLPFIIYTFKIIIDGLFEAGKYINIVYAKYNFYEFYFIFTLFIFEKFILISIKFAYVTKYILNIFFYLWRPLFRRISYFGMYVTTFKKKFKNFKKFL
jgi:hypothetical protein